MSIKKLISKLLCHPIIGQIIYLVFNGKIFDLRWRTRYYVPKDIDPMIYASIFWGFYESAERRLIEKYLNPDLSIIEIGASLGVVSRHLTNKMAKNAQCISVEMNASLLENIEKNIDNQHKSASNHLVLHAALNYLAPETYVKLSRNTTESTVTAYEAADTKVVPSITLSDLYQRIQSQKTALVCDIEGSEMQLILEDASTLCKFDQIFLEIHDTSYKGINYDKAEIISILTNQLNLQLVAQDGWVLYLKPPTKS